MPTLERRVVGAAAGSAEDARTLWQCVEGAGAGPATFHAPDLMIP